MTPTDAARAARLPSPNTIYNLLAGRASSLSMRTIEALAAVIPGATVAALSGLEPSDTVGQPQRPIQIRSIAAAGLMQASADLPPRRQKQLVTTLPPQMYAQGVFAVEVDAPGAELIYPEGTVLFCIPIQSYEGEITDGKRLILQRIHGDKVEVTVREVKIDANEAWLWLRSTHPEYQSPVRMPYVPGQPPQAWRVGEDRFIVSAVVVLAVVPQP